MERQAKDGTFYKMVAKDEWEPVTRQAKDGTVFKKVGADEWEPLQSPQSQESESYWDGFGGRMAQSFENAGRSLLGGRTLGLSEPIISGINAVGNTIAEGSLDPERVRQNYQADVERRRQQIAQMPIANLAGNIAGGLSPNSAINQVAQGASSVVRQGANSIAQSSPRLGQFLNSGVGKVALGTAEGAAQAGALTAANNQIAQASGFMKPEEAPSVLDGMLIGGVLSGGIQSAPYILKGAKEGSKYAMSALLGPKKEAIDRYLQRADAVKGAKSVEEMKNIMDDSMAAMFDDVEAGKISKDDAKEALKAVEDRIKDATRDAQFQFRIKQADVKQMFNDSKTALENSFKAQKETLEAIKSPIQLADDVQTALQDLKRQVQKASGESAEILGQQKGAVKIDGFLNAIDDIENSLYIGQGNQKVLRSNDAEAALPSLAKWREKLYALSDKNGAIPLTTLKDVVKGIDSDAQKFGDKMAGSFSDAGEQTMYALRGRIDNVLKDVPGYREKMEETAALTRLLKSASENFGTPQMAVSKLNSIAGRAKGIERDVLGALGSATGRDFLTPVDQFVKAQNTLKDPRALEQIKRGLPEYKDFRLQSMAKSQATRPEAPVQYVQGAINAKGLPMERAKAAETLTAAEQRLMQAQETLEPFKSLTPLNTQNAIQGLMKAPGKENFELRKRVQALSEMSQKDFMKWIDDRRALDQFQGEFRIGSRNVNLWSLVSGVIGGTVGGLQGAGLAVAVSAPTAALVDRFGPKMAQKILDGVLKIQGQPTIQKINQLSLPPEAKRYLANQWVLFQRNEGQAANAVKNIAGGELDQDSSTNAQYRAPAPAKGPDKWALSGAEKLGLGLSIEQINQDPKLKKLLIEASDLQPGSKAYESVKTRIKGHLSNDQ